MRVEGIDWHVQRGSRDHAVAKTLLAASFGAAVAMEIGGPWCSCSRTARTESEFLDPALFSGSPPRPPRST